VDRFKRNPVDVVQIHFEVAALSLGAVVTEQPFAPGMVLWNSPHREVIGLEYGLESIFKPRSFLFHDSPISGPNIIGPSLFGVGKPPL